MNIIYEAEVVVVGSGFKALSCAKSLGAAGKRVLLIARETFLGYEACMHNRFFFNENEYKALLGMGCRKAQRYGKYFCYIPDELKCSLEDALLGSGVKILYAACFLGDFNSTGKRAVMLASKAGIQAVLCDNLIYMPNIDYDVDCNELYRYGDIINIAYDESVKKHIESRFDNIKVYPGAFESGHIVLESRFEIPEDLGNGCNNLNRKMLLQYATAKELLLNCENILKLDGFEKAAFGKMGFKPIAKIADIADLIDEGYIAATEKTAAKAIGQSGREQPASSAVKDPAILYENQIYNYKYKKQIDAPSCQGHLTERPYDIVIAGGGTSGVPAAIGASGQSVAIIEMNPVLGGTATIGGVNAYWFGHRGHATEIIDSATARWHRRLRTDYRGGWWSEHDVWNGDIKAFALLELCVEKGIDVYFDQIICGAAMDGDRIAGCITAEGGSQNIFLSEIMIDATGDGDIAAFAGAEYVYGSKKDGISFWASLAQFTTPAAYLNNFSSTVYVGDPFDYTRFIMLNRRSRPCYDHGAYVAPRESRHIKGRCHISLEDVILGKKYSSYVHTCFSNYDPKGKSSSDIIYLGLLPSNLEIQVPLGVFLPLRIRGLVVAGKAFSCDHDAFPPLRMQPDLQEIGYNLGRLAGYCVSRGLGLDRLSDAEINNILGFKKTSKPCTFDPGIDIELMEGTEVFEWIDMDPKMSQKSVPGHVKACLKSEYIPYLKKAFTASSGAKRNLLARLLLWHGCRDGSELIKGSVLDELSRSGKLPRRIGSISFCQLPPDHGVMPEIVYDINLIANSGDLAVIEILRLVLKLLKDDKRDYYDIRAGIFGYIECFSFAAQRINDPGLDILVREVMMFPEFDSISGTGILQERLLILYITLAKSIAVRDDKAAAVIERLKSSQITQISISASNIWASLTKRR